MLLLITFLLNTGAQEFEREFSKISLEEAVLKNYPEDPDAEALVLFDLAKSFFINSDNSFDVIYERTTRIKIFSEAGIRWGEVEIPFYQEGGIYEKVYDIEAITYNWEDGRMNRTALIPSNTHDEKINNSWIVRKFALPDVKAGSVIEYRYKIISQYKFNFRDWEFQWSIPVKYSEYEVRMIPFYEYSWLLQGATRFDEQSTSVIKGITNRFGHVTYQDNIYKYIMKDLPAFDDEEFITSRNDYIIKLDFQLSKVNYLNETSQNILTTWEEMIKDLLKHSDFGRFMDKAEKSASKVLNINALSGKSDIEKFNYILDYVKSNYSWNGMYGKNASKTTNQLIDEKTGNCADINLFTVGLLKSIGIEASPVLISTRDNGKIKSDYPYSHFFNYLVIVAKVGDRTILTDATEILCLNDRIPARCINDKGLIVSAGEQAWVGLETKITSETNKRLEITFRNDKRYNASLILTAVEYDALYYRNNYTDNRETIKKKLESKDFTIADSSITVLNQLNKDRPYMLSYNLEGRSEIINNKIYLSPFLNETPDDNPFKQSTRLYPVDMTHPRKKSYISKIEIPEGYQIDYLPTDQNISTPLFDMNYAVTNDNERVLITFDYHFKQSIYSEKDYSKLKYYYSEVVKKGNEKLVFSLKNSDN